MNATTAFWVSYVVFLAFLCLIALGIIGWWMHTCATKPIGRNPWAAALGTIVVGAFELGIIVFIAWVVQLS